MKRVISGLLRRQKTSFSQATQAGASQAAQAPQNDKFEDPLYSKFQVPVIRIITERGMTQGPATVLIGDVPTYSYPVGSIGIISFENIDKEGYLYNAFSIMQSKDEEQYKMTVPALARQYQKAHETLKVDIHPHNEYRTKSQNAVLCITDFAKLKEARRIGNTMGSEFYNADIYYYERSEGKIYHIENGAKGEEVILPRNILSLSNLAQNEEMQRFVNLTYELAVSDSANQIIEEKDGKIPTDFCNQTDVARIFRSDVEQKIEQKLREPGAKPISKVKEPVKRDHFHDFLPNH